MDREYVHPQLNREVASIAGSYILVREERLAHEGREVLYLLGYGVFDSTCCGMGGCAYAIVPGVVVEWMAGERDGQPVSRVEPIEEESARRAVEAAIRKKETLSQVRFL
jgi:hypothetical protein